MAVRSFEDMGDHESDHRCYRCGGWWWTCGCSDRCPECEGLLNERGECTDAFCDESSWSA